MKYRVGVREEAHESCGRSSRRPSPLGRLARLAVVLVAALSIDLGACAVLSPAAAQTVVDPAATSELQGHVVPARKMPAATSQRLHDLAAERARIGQGLPPHIAPVRIPPLPGDDHAPPRMDSGDPNPDGVLRVPAAAR